MSSYAGVDWASDKHDVLVANEVGDELLAAKFAHDESGLRVLCRMLVRMEVELVAIERHDGLLVERLLEAGLRVLAMHPNQVAAARDRFGVSGGKSDRFDAFVLCELARTDSHRFRVLEPVSHQTKALRWMTRGREDLVEARTALVNRRRAELERFWPGPLRLFSQMHSQIVLAFLERYPSPADARGLGVARLQAFLERERYSGRQQPAALLTKLRSAPEVGLGELELATRPSAGAHLGRHGPDAEHADQGARAADRDRHPRASRRPDLPVAVQAALQRDHGRGDARRDGRLPRALPHPRRARRRRGTVGRRQGIRQAQDRHVPLGLQQTPPRRVLHPRRQHPPLAPLGARPLRPSPPTRPRTPPRRAHRRTGMVSCRMALLARPHPIRSRASPGAATTCHCHDSHAVGPRARPRCHPADGRRRCHPTGRPAGPSAKRLTASRHPLLHAQRLTQDVFGGSEAAA